ncbi:MAG: SH3 domain-containing protein [Anaerolineales bacterium]|nr:SH3 domain-containing protein [Anaerolineales bacterium]
MNKIQRIIIVILAASLFSLVSCSSQATVTDDPTKTPAAVLQPTHTPDPCAPENIQTEVEIVHKLMREFDDASILAANSPAGQLSDTIANLQRIRRDAEDLKVPACLNQLKTHQLAHMNTVINTMVSFMGGTTQETLNDGIALARRQHDEYTLEMLRLLGVTLVAATPDPNQPTSAPDGTTGTPNAQAAPAAGITATNPGPTSANLRSAPDLNASASGILEVGQTANVLGITADYGWLLIENPGQPGATAWVYSSLVELSSGINTIPIITPTP